MPHVVVAEIIWLLAQTSFMEQLMGGGGADYLRGDLQ